MVHLFESGRFIEAEPRPKHIALIFPGQGTQNAVPGIAKMLYENSPAAKQAFDEADDNLGFPLSKLCTKGTPEDLKPTGVAQLAVFTTSVACLRALEHQRPGIMYDVSFVAGHSLGEYTALVAAGGLPFGDAVRLVRDRGRITQHRVHEASEEMAAIVGLPVPEAQALCEEIGREKISIANINVTMSDYTQIVVSGFRESVERMLERARELQARVRTLEIDGAFHSPLKKVLKDAYARIVAAYDVAQLEVPLIQNITAQPTIDAQKIKGALVEHLWKTVLWAQSMEFMAKNGVNEFVECGPGRVLSNMARRNFPTHKISHAQTFF